MKTRIGIGLLILIVVAFVTIPEASAFSSILTTFLTKYSLPTSSPLNTCITCHTAAGTSTWNSYGTDLRAQITGGASPTQGMTNIEPVDSDGDGFTNLQEITATPPTFPGDPLSFPPSPMVPLLVSSITPTSRNAQLGTPVTIFMSVINFGNGTASNVSITQASGLPVTVSYQQWNGTAFTGLPDTPADIAAGATANYVLTISATSAFTTSSLMFNVSGRNAAVAPISGVNTLTLAASATPTADVIMISTTLDVRTAVSTSAFFALATSNVGATATGVSLVVTVPSSITGLAVQVNQTDPATGAIIGPATGLTINAGAQPTFAVFLTPTQAITRDLENNRIVLRLVDDTGKVIGAQSVAVSSP